MDNQCWCMKPIGVCLYIHIAIVQCMCTLSVPTGVWRSFSGDPERDCAALFVADEALLLLALETLCVWVDCECVACTLLRGRLETRGSALSGGIPLPCFICSVLSPSLFRRVPTQFFPMLLL